MIDTLRSVARKLAAWQANGTLPDADVISFLRCPYGEIIDFAVSLCNLTHREADVINLCGRQKYTQFEVAELLDCSEDAVQVWFKTAKHKLRAAWSSRPWLTAIIEKHPW